MKTLQMRSYLEALEVRKRRLGILDTPEDTEAMRNKGGRRTPEKREMLRRLEERARAAGDTEVKSYY
jgi:hypothetical protein